MRAFIETYGYLIVLLPLMGAAINGALGRRLAASFGERPGGYIACLSVAGSFALSLAAFTAVLSAGGEAIVNRAYVWVEVGNLRADVAFLFDPLSAVMILIITGVGLLIHVYSTAYMKGDEGYYRYFSYLNLFVFAMLLLVLGENALLMFIGWEGVGLCSYLLIGFWFSEQANAIAANKAFIVNRIGDFGFLVGLFLLYWLVFEGTGAGASEGVSLLSFTYLAANVHLLEGVTIFGVGAATVVCLALFIGAAGKSAQIPLYVWLPDAMAGPTPVSALIHAATMVTAGVYMIGRLNPLFSMSPVALAVVAVIGAGTALFAATMGVLENDIKKVLAYSTVSQLGYMFLAMGVGAYSAGIFHLLTHAFFKACLFLGAGSVIIAMHHEQDIRRMGGLRSSMPRTSATFIIAAASIAGLPPLSGFFSKDEILWSAFASGHGHPALWLVGLLTAGLTAFYMTRLVVLVFFGKNRSGEPQAGEEGHGEGIKESPAAITVPLIVLAFFSVTAGFVGVPGKSLIAGFLEPALGRHEIEGAGHALEYALMAASVLTALGGAGLAVLLYIRKPELPGLLAGKFALIYRLVYRKYYVDEIYGLIFVEGTKALARASAFFDKYAVDLLVNLSGLLLRVQSRIAGWFDDRFIDGMVNLLADSVMGCGDLARRVQTGRVQAYILVLLLAVAGGIVIKAII